MIDLLSNFLNTPVFLYAALTIQLAVGMAMAYAIIRGICSLSAAGRWKVVKVVLTILFLPFVLIYTIAAAGSGCGCGCWCENDD